MLSLYKPSIDDLYFRQELLSDSETMSYNEKWGGTIEFPREKWIDWYKKWILMEDGLHYYRYLFDECTSNFVGEVSYHYSEEDAKYLCDVIIISKYRNRGYGSKGLYLLCKAAKENGVEVLYDDIAIDNPSYKLFLKNGFEIDHFGDEIIRVKKLL